MDALDVRKLVGLMRKRKRKNLHRIDAIPSRELLISKTASSVPRGCGLRLLDVAGCGRRANHAQAWLDAHAGEQPEAFYETLQKRAARDCGFETDDQQALAVHMMRCAASLLGT